MFEDLLECWDRYKQQHSSVLNHASAALSMWSILRTASYAKFVKSEVAIPFPVRNRAGREVDLSGVSLEVRSLTRRSLFGVVPLPAYARPHSAVASPFSTVCFVTASARFLWRKQVIGRLHVSEFLVKNVSGIQQQPAPVLRLGLSLRRARITAAFRSLEHLALPRWLRAFSLWNA